MGLATLLQNSERVEAQVTQRVEARLRLAISEAVGSEMRKVLTGREEEPGGLSEREVQVLQAVADGMYGKQIAAELHIAHATVRNHLTHIFDKLGATTAAGAVAQGFRLRILR